MPTFPANAKRGSDLLFSGLACSPTQATLRLLVRFIFDQRYKTVESPISAPALAEKQLGGFVCRRHHQCSFLNCGQVAHHYYTLPEMAGLAESARINKKVFQGLLLFAAILTCVEEGRKRLAPDVAGGFLSIQQRQ